MPSLENIIAKVIAYTALVLGAGSLLWFGLFLYAGSFSVFDLGLGFSGALWMNAGLSGLFFAQHSIMLRKQFRARVMKIMPKSYFGAFFGISSAAALLVVLFFWQETSYMVFTAEGGYRVLFRLVFLASLAGFAWGVYALRSFDSSGAKTLLNHAAGRQPESPPLTIQGPYQYVRHPMYLISLILIWSCPDISADRFLFNLLWSGWIVLGTTLEEKDLVEDSGDDYRKYQKTVPMLIPWKIRKRSPEKKNR